MTRHSLFLFSLAMALLLATCFSCKKWQPEVSHPPSMLRISTESDPQTLDPRLARDLQTATAIQMLYEGLMRNDLNGQPQPAIAETVTLSPDQKTYTFKLRKSAWSNGQPITAQDFEQSWKSLLDPHFPAPNAYQFYAIKGAKAAKEGQIPLDQVGIQALDEKTLVVELNQPTPYFLHLTATYFFYPVSADLRQRSITVGPTTDATLVSNGPFKLTKWSKHNELIAIKNPYYWDKQNIQLNKIVVVVVDNSTALQMFGRNELDWTGSPLSTIPADAIVTLKQKADLHTKPGAGTFFFRINIEKEPFAHPKIRQALSLAINRQELVDHVLQGNQMPALNFVPASFIKNPPLYKDHDLQTAQTLLNEFLEEQHLTLKDLAPITLCYATGERGHKIAQAVQQQWKQALGIDVLLQSCESKVFYDLLNSHHYQISIGSWFADVQDPTAFLEIFKFKNNGTNNTQWENSTYIQLLDLAAQETQAEKREALFKQAESVLMQEMPLIPLFYSAYNYLKSPALKGVYFSDLGYLDFKYAYINSDE